MTNNVRAVAQISSAETVAKLPWYTSKEDMRQTTSSPDVVEEYDTLGVGRTEGWDGREPRH